LCFGVTFDQSQTWKQQIEKSPTKAKSRMAIMKKLAGTTWGADSNVIKTLYTGSVGLALEYGIVAWATAAQSNFNKVSRIQNQVMRSITRAMRSTPIQELETITGLQPMEDIRDSRSQRQAEKFLRLENHPMYLRMNGLGRGRLKRSNFAEKTKLIIREHSAGNQVTPKLFGSSCMDQTWSKRKFPELSEIIKGIESKNNQTVEERKFLAVTHIPKYNTQAIVGHMYTQMDLQQILLKMVVGESLPY
jgi:hypothetical protein